MLVGVLGGPVGMLLGRSAGAASGALYDADRLDTGDEAIEQFGALVPTGGNALPAETMEETTEPLDTFVADMGGSIVRRPLDEVVSELEAKPRKLGYRNSPEMRLTEPATMTTPNT